MGENTGISWADDTFNPWIGCQKVSPACDGCYAEALMDTRLGKVTWGQHGERVRTGTAYWAKPLKWNREQEAYAHNSRLVGETAEPRFVFCASLADVFDNQVRPQWRRDLFDLIRATPHLTWLLLTKRPQNIIRLFRHAMLDPPDGGAGYPWPQNAMAGTSIEDVKRLAFNAEALAHAKRELAIPQVFWSCEPLLEDLGDVHRYLAPAPFLGGVRPVDWVITGGETDQGAHKARPSHTDWFRSLRDQCAAAGVAYHHKQNGEWAPIDDDDGPTPVYRVGKKAAGRLLDGVTHDARPAVTP